MKLTNKHEEKLLKICKILYPGRDIEITYSDIEPLILEEGDLNWPEAFRFIWIIDHYSDKFEVYPLFEFCCDNLLTELINCEYEISGLEQRENYQTAFFLHVANGGHPVDWLWKFYQSIPKGQ